MEVLIFTMEVQKSLFFGLIKKKVRKTITVCPGDCVTIKYRSLQHACGYSFFAGVPGSFVENVRSEGEKVYLDMSCPIHELDPEPYITTICASDIVAIWRGNSPEGVGAVLGYLIERVQDS